MEITKIDYMLFSCHHLVRDYPPDIYDQNKLTVYQKACSQVSKHEGDIAYSRWSASSLPAETDVSSWQSRLEIRPDVFGYESTTVSGVIEWYLNFAHYDLFCAYGGPLLAQDELQVAEHPALCSLREALLQRGKPFGTVEDDRPTPVLIRNVERRCSIDTRPNISDGLPYGLYGNEFARATPAQVVKAVKLITPPTLTNIIAIEAPSDGYGEYETKTIEFILNTAITGFSAARHESHSSGAGEVVIHTGFWGCGAYGGDRVLMTTLQIIAANVSGIDRLIFHTVNEDGVLPVHQAIEFVRNGIRYDKGQMAFAKIIEQIVSCGFEWGESDGN